MLDDRNLGVAVVGLGLVGAEQIKAYVANPSYEIVTFVSRDKGAVVDWGDQ